jgi:transposase
MPADVRTWRSPARLAALALRWRTALPAGDGAAEIAAMAEEWRRADRHLWEIEAHDRNQLSARRDNEWRKVAAWLARTARVIVIDDSDLAELRRRGDLGDDDPALPGLQQQKARARAAQAAPGRLRHYITRAAVLRSVPVQQVSSRLLTRTCPECGHVGEPDRGPAAAVIITGACGHSYDQDHGAARLMLDRARGSKRAPVT